MTSSRPAIALLLVCIALIGLAAAACSSEDTEREQPDRAPSADQTAAGSSAGDAAQAESPIDDPPPDEPLPSDDSPPADDPPPDDPPPAAADAPADSRAAESPRASYGDGMLSDGSRPPPAPAAPDGPLDPLIAASLDRVFATSGVDLDALALVGASGDARVAWLLSDLLRFFQWGAEAEAAVLAFEQLTGAELPPGYAWVTVTNWLIAWDLPAPPGYVSWKRLLFERVEPAWAPFFDDADAAIDWRLLSWGGVYIDNRPLSQVAYRCPRGCIPAIDHPAVTGAAGGDWYADDAVVFGVVVNGEARAYPKHIMEVHEMVNDTLGGRRIGMPYCTLCGSAQAYYTDRVPAGFEPIELRTSGLLSRSNKVMFDLHSYSVFDTFRGVAVSGPLQDEGYVLEMLTVVTSTWGEWKAAHPDTTIVAEDGGLSNNYSLDPLRGRDDDGPIFPVGPVDTRLPVQVQVLGIQTAEGEAIAFPVVQARAALDAGAEVELAGVRLSIDAGGLRAALADGTPIATHQAFWFAWSQFHPDTVVWTPLS